MCLISPFRPSSPHAPIQDPIQDHILHLAVMSLLIWNSSSAFVFHDQHFLKPTGQMFDRMPLNLGFSNCFLII